ncbi:MAG: glycosyltransferase [Luteitalea sp.]|nr:glycosyltransferase [Luteitalea sp.]
MIHMMNYRDPVRVLHVIGCMNRGGVETWLMHVLRSVDRMGFALDFLVHTDSPGAYDDEIRELGGRVIALPYPTRSFRFRYTDRFRTVLRECGPYDVVHSHVHHFSGVVLRAASLAGVGSRISHSHSDTSAIQAKATIARRAYLRITEDLIRRHSTKALAVSEQAGRALFPWEQQDSRCPWEVLHYGIALDPFLVLPDRTTVRRELGLDPDAVVIGHVGNLLPVKNHALLISAFDEVSKREPSSALLIIGAGPLQGELELQVASKGLTERVKFLGLRSDVPRLLMGAVDVFMFPSLWEGLPLAVIEAQAAGLPIVLSDRVSREVDILPGLIHRLAIESGPERWASVCLQASRDRLSPALAHRGVAGSDMNIQRSVKALQEAYESSMRQGGRPRAA